MRVDVTRENKLAGAIDLFAERRGILFPHRDAFDLVAVDHDSRIRQHLAVSRVNHSSADQRNFFGARTESNQSNSNTK